MIDKAYLNLVTDILENGVSKGDRTGTGTISVFGRQIRHNMSHGFPILTTKSVHFKSVVTELLWFLSGSTNITDLVKKNCMIWNGDAYKNYVNKAKSVYGDDYVILPMDLFVTQLKQDDVFGSIWGEMGPIYGAGWRRGVDQFSEVMNELARNPDSRRLLVDAWNAEELKNMILPPCHFAYQFYSEELSLEERKEILLLQSSVQKMLEGQKIAYATPTLGLAKGFYKQFLQRIPSTLIKSENKSDLIIQLTNGGALTFFSQETSNRLRELKFDCVIIDETTQIQELKEYSAGEAIVLPTSSIENSNKYMDDKGVPRRRLSLMWYQRSVDVPLGLPFNIASYGLLLEMVASVNNMVPGELVGSLADCHIYKNQIDGIRQQLERKWTELPKLKILRVHAGKSVAEQVLSIKEEDIVLVGYKNAGKLEMPLSN